MGSQAAVAHRALAGRLRIVAGRSLEETAGVWINIGAAYHKKGDKKRAYEAFKHALQDPEERILDRDRLLAARNLTVMLWEDKRVDDVLTVTTSIVNEENAATIAGDRGLSDILVIQISALNRRGFLDEAIDLSHHLLQQPRLSLIGKLALREEGLSRALASR